MTGRFSRLTLINGWDAQSVAAARVAVIGAGTSGTEVAKDLALCGVGELLLVDPDVVEAHNASMLFDRSWLGRPKVEATEFALGRVAPETKIVIHQSRLEALGEAIFEGCSAVVLCLDNLATRVTASRWAALLEIPCVDVGVDGLSCRVQTSIPGSACFACGLWPEDFQDLAARAGCTGRAVAEVAGPLAISVPGAALGAALAAEEVLRMVFGGPTAARFAGRELRWSAGPGSWTEREIPRRRECDGHDVLRRPLVRVPMDDATTSRDVMSAVAAATGSKVTALEARRSLVYGVRCGCGWGNDRPAMLGDHQQVCPHCGDEPAAVSVTSRLRASLRLMEAGFPDRSVARARQPGGAWSDVVMVAD